MQWTIDEPGTLTSREFWILYDPEPGTIANFTAYHGQQEIGRTSTLEHAKTLVADLAEIGLTIETI